MDKAIKYFKQGLELVVQQGRYGNDIPQTYVKRLQKFMVDDLQLSTEQIRNIGSLLLTQWRQDGLDVEHPDIRILLSKWSTWEGVQA
jgi:hypothetical protein